MIRGKFQLGPVAEEGEAGGGPTDCRASCARGTRAAGFAGGPFKEPLQPAEPEGLRDLPRRGVGPPSPLKAPGHSTPVSGQRLRSVAPLGDHPSCRVRLR